MLFARWLMARFKSVDILLTNLSLTLGWGWATLFMKTGGAMSSLYLRRDQIKAGTLLRSKEDGSLCMILGDPNEFGYEGYVLAYDFRKGERVQLNASYIHADFVGGNDG
mgnify:CR=1 FL=1